MMTSRVASKRMRCADRIDRPPSMRFTRMVARESIYLGVMRSSLWLPRLLYVLAVMHFIFDAKPFLRLAVLPAFLHDQPIGLGKAL